jgi:phage shock protein E
MKNAIWAVAALMLSSAAFAGQPAADPGIKDGATAVDGDVLLGSPLIDYPKFEQLTAEVGPYRAKRLVSLKRFMAMARNAPTLLIDARSAQAFAEGHIDGAINIPLPDFTADRLAEAIGPDQNRPILIYCNNNFRNNVRPVVTKALPLALNISTFINLVGYGYRNVWELGEAVDMNNPDVAWVNGA